MARNSTARAVSGRTRVSSGLDVIPRPTPLVLKTLPSELRAQPQADRARTSRYDVHVRADAARKTAGAFVALVEEVGREQLHAVPAPVEPGEQVDESVGAQRSGLRIVGRSKGRPRRALVNDADLVMLGRPLASSRLTNASPTANSVIAVSMSSPGFWRMVCAVAFTAFWSRGV